MTVNSSDVWVPVPSQINMMVVVVTQNICGVPV
jgi:hypothetical protein